MKAVFALISCVVLLTLFPAEPAIRGEEPTSADVEFFEKEVRQLLVDNCVKCHGTTKPKGNLKLTSRAEMLRGGDNGTAIVSGKPDESLLINAVRYRDEFHMPPRGKLSDRQIEVLEKWVKRGAPWPGTTAPMAAAPQENGFTITAEQRQFWSFQPVKAVPAPTVRNSSWSRTPVDQFILAALEAKQLSPAVPADKRTLLRRATFDLIGLPPTPAEIDAFLADETPQAFAKVVDRLLASPLYGERWGRHWLDVVRYADARDLIQLPRESDFRESWRYRDWVVDSFNRDRPFTEFVRSQLAGDLLPAAKPGAVNQDGLVATGLLAIADFVPGDVDKNQMIADYVNDQIDVVGRAFLGLSVACARCHDHKFDPISTEDYYALAGIFFSSRIVPGPVPGNTPLVRVPLLSEAEIKTINADAANDTKRRAELEATLPASTDNAYRDFLSQLLVTQSSRYLLAAGECRVSADGKPKPTTADVAKKYALHEGVLSDWIKLLDRVEKNPTQYDLLELRNLASGKLSHSELEKNATAIQNALAAVAKRDADEAIRFPEKQALARATLLQFRADDPRLAVDKDGRVTQWPNRAGSSINATPPVPKNAPIKTNAQIGDNNKPVIRFDGKVVFEVPLTVPQAGTLFVVYRSASTAQSSERLVGWEDSDVGKHGLGLMTEPGGKLSAILRKDGRSGDLVNTSKSNGFETVGVSWGTGGTTLRRNGAEVAASKSIDGISSDPKITSLKIGGPGSGKSPRFHGDVAELRVYSRPLTKPETQLVEAELRETWFRPDDPKKSPRDPYAELYVDLLAANGAFWPAPADRSKRLSPDVQKRIATMTAELETLRKKTPKEIPQAVAIQEGGPKGTRHEGFADSHVFIRGDHKRLGKTVPRGIPKVLQGEREEKITGGSGRLQLANWLARPENPLTARVMVNRIWQHHFGEGLVRTPNDFGSRGERPTNPEMLDFLANRFIESNGSVKTMHRLIMLSAVYQQSGKNDEARARDPENRLLGRFNRQRLDAEAIRDSLLAVSGKLDLSSRGGMPFSEIDVPRRTLYLLSARTSANTSDFGRLFDRADPSLIVAQRGQSVVAPQALFFLNDPFVNGMAKALAARVEREAPANAEGKIRQVYSLALGRSPTKAEYDLGTNLLSPAKSGDPDPLQRYCHLILCTNEFLYID